MFAVLVLRFSILPLRDAFSGGLSIMSVLPYVTCSFLIYFLSAITEYLRIVLLLTIFKKSLRLHKSQVDKAFHRFFYPKFYPDSRSLKLRSRALSLSTHFGYATFPHFTN